MHYWRCWIRQKLVLICASRKLTVLAKGRLHSNTQPSSQTREHIGDIELCKLQRHSTERVSNICEEKYIICKIESMDSKLDY